MRRIRQQLRLRPEGLRPEGEGGECEQYPRAAMLSIVLSAFFCPLLYESHLVLGGVFFVSLTGRLEIRESLLPLGKFQNFRILQRHFRFNVTNYKNERENKGTWLPHIGDVTVVVL